MMVAWRGKVASDTRINTPVVVEDFFPSFCEMAHVENPQTVQTRDGQSFVKLVTDGSQYVAQAKKDGKIRNQKEANAFPVPTEIGGIDPERDLIFHYPHQLRFEDQDDIDFMTSMRRGDWKLVYRMHTGELELYNLKDDLGERHNLVAKNKKLVKSMAKDLGAKLRAWEASMPTVRATGKTVPYPDEI